MAIDLEAMDPAERSQAEMFLMMVQQMPSEAVRFLILLLEGELEDRGD